MSDGLVDLIARLAALDGLDPIRAPARAKALDDVGEGRRDVSIAVRGLAPRLS